MFSENEKISGKQLRRMLMLTTFAGMIFVVPYVAANLFGDFVVCGLGMFFVCAMAYIGIIFLANHLTEINRESKNEKSLKKRKRKRDWLTLVQVCRQFINFVFYVILTIAILGEAQVPFMEGSTTDSYWNILIVIPLLLVAVYGAGHGVEQVARLFEIFFWIIFIPFFILIIFGLGEVDYSVFLPKCGMPAGEVLLYSLGMLSFLVPVEQFLFLSKRRNPQGKGNGKTYLFLVLTVGIIIGLSLFIYGIYGIRGASMEEMVTVDIMRYIRLPLGILERFDIVMVWFFMLGSFVLLCSSLFYVTQELSIRDDRKRILWMAGIVVAGLVLVYWLPNYKEALWLYFFYGAFINLPLSILLPFMEK